MRRVHFDTAEARPVGILVAAASLTGVSFFLAWVSVTQSGSRDLLPFDVPVLAWFLVIVAAVSVAAAVASALMDGPPKWLRVVALAQLGMAAVLIVVIEAAPALIPTGALPETVRRYAVDIGAGSGIWTYAAGGLLLALVVWLRADSELGDRAAAAALALTGLAMVDALLIYLRGRVWLSASVAGDLVSLRGHTVPWEGQISLLLVLGLPIACCVYLVTGRWEVLLPLGVLAYASSVAASVVIALGVAGRSLQVPGLSEHVMVHEPRLAPMLFIVACLSLAVSIAWAISRHGRLVNS